MSSKDSVNSFGARDTLKVGDKSYEIYRLDAVPGTEKLPYSLKVLAEWLNVRQAEIRSFLQGRLTASRAQELRGEMLAAGIPL